MNARVLVLFNVLSLTTTAYAADEIHWTIMGQQSVAVNWRGTNTESNLSYGTSPGVYSKKITAVKPNPLPSSPGSFWEARINDLKPNTRYYYRIGKNTDEHSFRTPPLPGRSNFIAYAESDVSSVLVTPRVKDDQTLITKDARFVLVTGDLTYGDKNGFSYVDKHFNDVMVWSQDVAYMPAWGNHDWNASTNIVAHLNEYEGRFSLPNTKTSPGSDNAIGNGAGEDWYWFDYGNVRFIAYPEPFTNQTWQDWQQKVKAILGRGQLNPNIDFMVTFGHRPAYSSGFHNGEPALKSILDALGDKYSKYVLNINGHSHNYERSFPQHGVMHLTVGTGGTPLETKGTCLWTLCKKPSWSNVRAMHHGVVRLRFTKTAIQGSFICGPAEPGKNDITCKSGEVVDSFIIAKPGK